MPSGGQGGLPPSRAGGQGAGAWQAPGAHLGPGTLSRRAERERPQPASPSGADTRSHCSTLTATSVPGAQRRVRGPVCPRPRRPTGETRHSGRTEQRPPQREALAPGHVPHLPVRRRHSQGTRAAPAHSHHFPGPHEKPLRRYPGQREAPEDGVRFCGRCAPPLTPLGPLGRGPPSEPGGAPFGASSHRARVCTWRPPAVRAVGRQQSGPAAAGNAEARPQARLRGTWRNWT